MDRNKRYQHSEIFVNNFTLQAVNIFYFIFRKYPAITKDQKTKIKPFFIIGAGRSGNTLLRIMLCRNSTIGIPPESYILPKVIKKYFRYRFADWEDLTKIVIGEFSMMRHYKEWNIDFVPVLKNLTTLDKKNRSLAKILDSIYRAYLDRHHKGASIWGDKTPFNLLRIKWINKVFPNAKYIHIIRDGRDVVNSYMKAKLYPSIDYAIKRWNDSIEAAHSFQKNMSPENFLEIRYEELIQDPEATLKCVCQFLDIEFSEDMLDSRKNIYLGDNNLNHMFNVNKPVFKSSIGKWKSELDLDQQILVENSLKKNLKKLGYLAKIN